MLLSVLLVCSSALAQGGALDQTFSSDGKVTTDFLGGNDIGRAVVIQSDGKIVVAGEAHNGNDLDFALARYNSDGTLDLTFGSDGKVSTDFLGNRDRGRAIAIQSDGKIVVAGSATRTNSTIDFALARYNVDGSLDSTFNSDGKVTPDHSGTAIANGYAIAIQSDGKIVAAGYVVNRNWDFALARYNTDGTLDPTFDSDGKVTTDFLGKHDFGYAAAIQSDGKIVVAGFAVNGTYEDFALARYNTDGTLDPTFNNDGKVTTDFLGKHDSGYAMAIQTDGKIILAGRADNSSDYDLALACYNSDGILDPTFDSDGKVTTDFLEEDNFGRAIAIQSDGKIVAAGFATVTNLVDTDFALARYNDDGSLDTTFDSDGKVTTDFMRAGDGGRAIAIQSDGKIVVAGNARITGSNIDFAVVRYLNENPVSVELSPSATVSTEFALDQNYPNPFNPETQIQYQVVAAGRVQLSVFNLLGQRVRNLVSEFQEPGNYAVMWDGKDDNGQIVQSGIYVYEMRVGDFVERRKATFLK